MTDLISVLKKNQPIFSPVVAFDPLQHSLLSLDFTNNNRELNNSTLNDIDLFSNYIRDKLDNTGALYGIGGYGEHRTIYSRSNLFDSETEAEEPRRLHLGTDIWGKANTKIMAPLEGTVHSYAFNDRAGDYGATIILYHELNEQSFYTLYGHLDLQSIKELHEGDKISKGKEFARFGIPAENGHWPPHLHFQLIIDMQGYRGDYPGVCKYGEKEKWLSNSPDPDFLLQLNRYL